jgi:hypothetical protein
MILAQNIMALTANERAQLFAMLSEHIDIFIKILPNITLLNQIKTDTLPTSSQDPLTKSYLVWKNQT